MKQFRWSRATWRAEDRSEALLETTDIHPHDMALLIAMAQESQRVQSKSDSQDHKAALFAPVLITPTPGREAIYIYRASISAEYLESFVDVHKPLETEMHISRATIPCDDTEIILETLGEVLDLHNRLETDTKEGTRTQKRAADPEESSRSVKRHRHSKLPLVDIETPNLIPGV